MGEHHQLNLFAWRHSLWGSAGDPTRARPPALSPLALVQGDHTSFLRLNYYPVAGQQRNGAQEVEHKGQELLGVHHHTGKAAAWGGWVVLGSKRRC